MSTSYDINGIGGVGGAGGSQSADAPPSGQASNTDISMFEQQIEALLQAMKAQDAASGGSGQPSAMRAPEGGGGAAPFSGASGSNASGAGSSQPITSGGETGASQGQNTVQLLEQAAEELLQALDNRNGAQDMGGGTRAGAPSGGAAAGAAPGAAIGGTPSTSPAQDPAGMGGTAPASQDPSTTPASQQASAEPGGGTMSVDGAKPGGDTVAMQVVNNTGKDEKVALTNSQNQTFADVDLKAGQKETFLLDPNDPNTKSARMQTTNPDGSLRQDPKLTEFNLQPDHTAINVSNNNFAGITGTDGHAVDSEQMKIDDNQGKVAGDGAANGAYRNSVDDANAMIMGDDSSKNYTVTIS